MIERLTPTSIPMRDYVQDAAEALEAFQSAMDAETREHRAHDYVTAATHAEVDRRFLHKGLTSEEAVIPYLAPLQHKIRTAVGTAIRNQDRWVERCFLGRFRHLVANTHPAGRA